MTAREGQAMALCGLLAGLVLMAATLAQYWYAKSHHLLTGPLAVDDISQWWTEHIGWLFTLAQGMIGGCLLCFVFWAACRLLVGSNKTEPRGQ